MSAEDDVAPGYEHARFVARDNRFVVRAKLADEEEVQAYLPNTARLTDVLVPGARLVLVPATDPARRTRWTVTRVWDGTWVSLEAGRASAPVEDHLAVGGSLPGWPAARAVRREVQRGRHRFDLEVVLADEREAIVEVKSLSRARAGVAPLSATPSTRGVAHLGGGAPRRVRLRGGRTRPPARSGPWRSGSRLARMSDDDRLLTLATDWIAGDPDPGTRAELQALVDAEDVETLRERVEGSLAFGTAGLRGVVGAGPLRMNRAVVIRTTKGLADHLGEAVEDLEDRVVVVGFDARHDSRRFAADTVGVLAAAGIRVRLFTQPTPTPLVAYAARDLGAAAAVVVTASHNPPEYNGYKVYGPDAAQIVPPTDEQIAEAIAAAPPADDVDRVEAPLQSDLVEAMGDDVLERYLAEVDEHRTPPDDPGSVRIVYTPLHGVAWPPLRRAFERAGYDELHVVEEQAEPDPAFPTVRFPNPEEEGALDLALFTARDADADLVLASDPDGDRLAVAVPHAGEWRLLTGNQLGVLLGDDVLAQGSGDDRMVLSSIVSSPMLRDVASAHGVRYEATLTGFKWIWNAALDLERDEGLRYVFGYEEALGYSVGPTVRDKDGISAALAFADLATRLQADGRSVMDELAELYRRHGLWTSIQHSVTRPGSEGQAEIAAAMQRIGHEQPSSLGGREVLVVTDYRHGEGERPRWLPATSLVSLELAGGSRVLIRPSGTEPKCKIYVDLRADLVDGDDVWEREDRLRDEAQAIGEELARFVGLT